MKYLALIALFMLLTGDARADDPANHGNPHHGWYENAETTIRSRERLNWMVRCCAQAEVVRTKFRVDRTTGDDVWEWYDPALNRWRVVPDDIIHWGEHAPDKRPTLFINAGKEVCFFPPEEGI